MNAYSAQYVTVCKLIIMPTLCLFGKKKNKVLQAVDFPAIKFYENVSNKCSLTETTSLNCVQDKII